MEENQRGEASESASIPIYENSKHRTNLDEDEYDRNGIKKPNDLQLLEQLRQEY